MALKAYTIPYSEEKSLPPARVERGQMLTKAGKLFNRHTTYFARGDLDWLQFGYYLKKKFPNIKDVDINVFGCSTGEEPYTLAMLLKKEYGNAPFAIHAMDISDDVIEKNKSNQQEGVEIFKDDISAISKNLCMGDEEIKRFTSGSNYPKKLKKNITNHVQFSKANILNSLDKIRSDKPSIIFCRNMWPYIDHKEYDNFAQKLYEKLAPGSVVAIGGYDFEGEFGRQRSDAFPAALVHNGFKVVYGFGYLVYEKN